MRNVMTQRDLAILTLSDLRQAGANDTDILNYLVETWMESRDALDAMVDYETYEF